MTQILVPKVGQSVLIGPDGDEASVPKLNMYVLLIPGEPSGEEPNRQAHVHTRIIKRS